MQVGDLRVFRPYTFYANNMFVVTHVDDMDCSITIRIIKTGEVECWDRIILLHDSKSVAVKKCP
jgi:hypothetical protein